MELKSIFVDAREFKITEENTIKIKSIQLGDLPEVLDLISKYLDVAPKLRNEAERNLIILKAVKEDFNSVLKLIEITTDIPKEDIKRLNLAATTLIASEVINENYDFLYVHVIPAVKALFQALSASKSQKDGSSKSKA